MRVEAQDEPLFMVSISRVGSDAPFGAWKKTGDAWLATAGDEILDLTRRVFGDPAAFHGRFVAELEKLSAQSEAQGTRLIDHLSPL
jgi:hypothetical protein